MYDLNHPNVKNLKIDFIKVLSNWHKEYNILDEWISKTINERKLDKEVPYEVFMAVEHYRDKVISKKINHIEEMMLICQEIEEE